MKVGLLPEQWKYLEEKSHYAKVSKAEWVRKVVNDRWRKDDNRMENDPKCFYPYKLDVSMEEGMREWIKVMSEVNGLSKAEVIRNCIREEMDKQTH